MRNLKRVLSLALALVMMLGMMIVTTSAAEAQVDFADADEITYNEAVDVMVALGVLQGDGTNFNPNDILTREQAAKIICYMLMSPENAEKLAGTSVFTDVAADRWSAPFVAYCASLDILAGNGDGTFDPTGELTGVAFAKMLLVALGYDAEVEGYVNNANWATNIATDAIEAGIDINGVTLSDPLTREQAAQMALNTLTATMVKYSGTGTTITTGDTTIVTGAGEAKAIANTTSTYVAAGTQPDNYDGSTVGTMQFCEKYFPTLLLTNNAVDGFGRTANTWVYGTVPKTVGTYTTQKPTYTYVVPAQGAPADVAAVVDKVVNSNTTDPANTAIYLNGYCDNTTAAGSFAVQKGDVVELFMSKVAANTVAKAVVIRYTPDVVATDPDTNVTAADKAAGVTAYTSFKVSGKTKDTEVPGFDAATYVKNAVVATAVNPNTNDIVDSYVLDQVSGAITAYGGSPVSYYTLDGVKYNLSAAATNNISTVDFKTGNYSLYTDKNDFVLYTKVNTATAAIEDVYYVATTYAVNNSAYGSATYKYYAQCVTMDGTTENIEISPVQFAGLVEYTVVNDDATSGDATDLTDTFKTGSNTAGIGFVDTTAAGGFTKVTDGITTLGSHTKYYKVAGTPTANQKVAAGLYTFKTVTDETYMEATAYAPTTGAYKAVTNAADTAITAKTTNWNGYKISADTKLILVKGTLDDMAVKVCTGPVELAAGNFDATATNNCVIYTTDANGNKLAAYIVIPTTSNKLGAVASADLLYCGSATATNVDGGKEFTMYNMSGEKVTIFVKTGKTEPTAYKFYDYSIASDGSYEISDASAAKDLDDPTSLVTYGYVNNIQFAGLFGTKISAGDLDGDSDDFIDVEAKDAVIVDLRAPGVIESSTYKTTINSLDKLYAAYQKGEIAMDVFASKANGIEVIFVRSVGAYTLTSSGDSNYATFYSNEACTVAITSATAGQTVYFKVTGTVATTDFTGIAAANMKNVTDNTTVAAGALNTAKTYSFVMPYGDVAESAAS